MQRIIEAFQRSESKKKQVKNHKSSLGGLYVPDLKIISYVVSGNAEFAKDLQRSDHVFWGDAGIPALMLSDGANFRNDNYHGPTDVIETLNMEFMTNVVKTVVASVASLAELKHSSTIFVAVEE